MTKWLSAAAVAALMACGWARGADAGTVSFRYEYPGFFSGQGSLMFSGFFDSADMNNGTASEVANDPSNPSNDYSFSGSNLTFNLQAITSLTDHLYHEIEIDVAGSNRCCHFGFVYNSPTFAYSETTATTTLTISGDFASLTLPSTVPLPAAAPLFGAGLLVLSGAAYTRRRMRSA